MATREQYVIVGFGWVGQANALALAQLGFDVSFFDPGSPPRHYEEHYGDLYASVTRLSSVLEKDAPDTRYMVCVGDRVSEDGVQDISYIRAALDSLKGAKGGVMLRSTILPGLLEELSFDWYVPEFLHEKKAVEECLYPYFFVIGKRDSAKPEPAVCALWRSRAHKHFSGTPREASLIKYLSNLWNATRIAFVNEFGDAVGRPTDKQHLSEIERVINFMFDRRMYLQYGRAFGGHCLPKDTRAFRTWHEQHGKPLPLISGAYESNIRHAQLEAELPLMPEWYSEWPDRHISGWHALRELRYALVKYLTRPRLLLVRVTNRRARG